MSDSIVIIGIILSIFFYEATQISPGGIIVPGYMALFVDSPERIVFTVLLSFLTYLCVNFISKYTIIYGKRKFAMFIVVSFILRFVLGHAIAVTNIPLSISLIIGYIVPGILAQEIDRQGALKTIPAMLAVTFCLKLIVILYPFFAELLS